MSEKVLKYPEQIPVIEALLERGKMDLREMAKASAIPQSTLQKLKGGHQPLTEKNRHAMEMLVAMLLVVGGLIGLVYFAAVFDTSVAVPGGGLIGVARVNNIGLQQDRMIGIVVSCVALVLGAVCALVPRRR